MCGISGIYREGGGHPQGLRTAIRKMGLWQCHRGPDAWGEWIEDDIALGHNRLSIIDVATGKQPMVCSNNHVVVVFNGEIYNFRTLWQELQGKGHHFITDHSDSEVIVNGYLEWGEGVFSRLEGMFAIGIWDRREKRLVLARDFPGIKPLYIAPIRENGLLFSSEPKAILASNLVSSPFRPEGLPEYFFYRAPRCPNTLWQNIIKLKPGHYQVFEPGKGLQSPVPFSIGKPNTDFDLSPDHAEHLLEGYLSSSVQSHLMSDVPLGVFLSGGVDSSLVAAMAVRDSPLCAFTVGTNSEWDETPYASKVAEHLGLRFFCKCVSKLDFLSSYEDWIYANDDPSADPSGLAIMVLSKYARANGMKAMLSGEGADELFGGYNSYIRYSFFCMLAQLPVVDILGKCISSFFDGPNRDYLECLNQLRFLGTGHLSDSKTRKGMFDYEISSAFENKLRSKRFDLGRNVSSLREAMLFDQEVRLPDDILMRTDRATMFHAIEARVPFLDKRLIVWSNVLPDHLCVKLKEKKAKILLKRLAEKYIPLSVIHRPKRGFELPIRDWLLSVFMQKLREYRIDRKIPGLNYQYIDTMLFNLERNIQSQSARRCWAWLIMEEWYRFWILNNATPRCPDSTIHTEAHSILIEESI